MARVPLDVIGEPLTCNPVGTVAATLVTVPAGMLGNVARVPSPRMY